MNEIWELNVNGKLYYKGLYEDCHYEEYRLLKYQLIPTGSIIQIQKSKD